MATDHPTRKHPRVCQASPEKSFWKTLSRTARYHPHNDGRDLGWRYGRDRAKHLFPDYRGEVNNAAGTVKSTLARYRTGTGLTPLKLAEWGLARQVLASGNQITGVDAMKQLGVLAELLSTTTATTPQKCAQSPRHLEVGGLQITVHPEVPLGSHIGYSSDLDVRLVAYRQGGRNVRRAAVRCPNTGDGRRLDEAVKEFMERQGDLRFPDAGQDWYKLTWEIALVLVQYVGTRDGIAYTVEIYEDVAA